MVEMGLLTVRKAKNQEQCPLGIIYFLSVYWIEDGVAMTTEYIESKLVGEVQK